jgi:flagellar biosynthesis/type III secretory pathway M-ring protein FliF/YscJ
LKLELRSFGAEELAQKALEFQKLVFATPNNNATSICCVWVYVLCVCVCVCERERERERERRRRKEDDDDADDDTDTSITLPQATTTTTKSQLNFDENLLQKNCRSQWSSW